MKFKIGENGRVLRERGEAVAHELFDKPLAELSRREMAEVLDHLTPEATADYSDPHHEVIDSGEASERLGVQPNSIDQWRRRGHLDAVGFGEDGRPVYSMRDLAHAEHATRGHLGHDPRAEYGRQVWDAIKADQPIPSPPQPEPLGDLGRLVTCAQAADLLSVQPATLRQWHSRGRLPQAVDADGAPVRDERGRPLYILGTVLAVKQATRSRLRRRPLG